MLCNVFLVLHVCLTELNQYKKCKFILIMCYWCIFDQNTAGMTHNYYNSKCYLILKTDEV